MIGAGKVAIGEWNVVEVKRRLKLGWLSLNDGVVVTGRSKVGGWIGAKNVV